MQRIIVTENAGNWHPDIADVCIISPSEYINNDSFKKSQRLRVINLCKSYQYQSEGYYISLLAEARGHKALPDISTIRDIKLHDLVRQDAEDFDVLIQETLDETVRDADNIEFSIYFGITTGISFSKIGQLLFNLFQMPMLRVRFVKKEKWQLHSLRSLNLKDLPDKEARHLFDALRLFLEGKHVVRKSFKRKKYDLAILVNPNDPNPPSDSRALQKFIKAADTTGFNTEFITKSDYGRITSFDALFIRETTNVNHHTFRFARKAEYEGLVVIDDPMSILKCTNKVYLNELLTANNIPTPLSVNFRKNELEKLAGLKFPFVLKQPDGSFSRGVRKVHDQEELLQHTREFFQKTDLLIAQEFMPSPFDWRVGVLGGKILYVCKYYMAKNHWQIIEWRATGANREGDSETIPLDQAPKKLISLALKASKLIGNGLYGVDIKEVAGKFYVIEINDNPSIDSGVEDKLGNRNLYETIMKHMMNEVLSI